MSMDDISKIFGMIRSRHRVQIVILTQDCKADKIIKEYFDNSKPWNFKIVKLWQVYANARKDLFVEKGFDKVDNWLLWHGTKRDNLFGIITAGFKIIGQRNQIFGPGVYFTDRVAKSANYTDRNGAGVLLLCQVALGRM